MVVCPHRTPFLNAKEYRGTGYYIIKAIRQLFGLSGSDLTDTAHGLVVEHKSRKVKYFGFQGASEEEMSKREQLNTKPNMTGEEWAELKKLSPRCKEEPVDSSRFKDVDPMGRRLWSCLFEAVAGWKGIDYEANAE